MSLYADMSGRDIYNLSDKEKIRIIEILFPVE